VTEDWDQRELCPDGTCVGLIGPDGLCKVCHRAAPNWGDERKRGLLEEPEEGATGYGLRATGEPQNDLSASPEARSLKPEAPSQARAEPDDWDDRQLCRDDTCIGLLGRDGKCKVCGK
jgi:hypothetical protein